MAYYAKDGRGQPDLKKIFDSHTHTAFSADSEMVATEAVERAREQGLGIVFTEHLDLDFPGELDFTFDPEAYWRAYEPLRGEDVRLGVEIGMQRHAAQDNRAFAERAPFDQVIVSQHLLDGVDLYEKTCYEGKDKRTVYEMHLADMRDNLLCHAFADILAHIDYITRYAASVYDSPELGYADYADGIDGVLRACIETDTVLELNTRRLGDRHAAKELLPLYARYRELGGKYVSIGSDAHGVETIGAHFAFALDMMEAVGLTPVTFCKRQMERCEK